LEVGERHNIYGVSLNHQNLFEKNEAQLRTGKSGEGTGERDGGRQAFTGGVRGKHNPWRSTNKRWSREVFEYLAYPYKNNKPH
jgi:hypothetical protein